MVWNWLFKRLFTPKRIAYLIKSNQKAISEAMKDSIQDVLEDEEIAKMIITTTDHIYARYLGKGGKLWATIGGVQKGLNYQVEGEMEKLNPFSNLIQEGEDISLSSIAKGFVRNLFTQSAGQPLPNQQIEYKGNVVPNM